MNIRIVHMINRSIKLVHKVNVFAKEKTSNLPDFGGYDTDR